MGVRRRSGEIWVATKDGVVRARSVRRIPKEERWCNDCLEWVRHVPWNKSKDDDEADGDIPEEKLRESEVGSSGGGGAPDIVVVNTREKQPRKFYIRKEDAERHGYSRGCGGCSSWFRGLGRQPHTEECRRRFEALMRKEAKVVNAGRKREEYVEKMKKQKTGGGDVQMGRSSSSAVKRSGDDIEDMEVKANEEQRGAQNAGGGSQGGL